MHAWAPLFLAALLQGGEMQEYQVSIRTKDNSTFSGTAKLPVKLTVKTKYGELATEIKAGTQLTRIDQGWGIRNSGAEIHGSAGLGPISLSTKEGTVTIPETDILVLVVQAPLRPAGYVPAPNAADAALKPAFSGHEFRQRYDPQQFQHAESALLLSGGRHLALLDRTATECVFLELASGKTTRVPVEAGASHMIERNGKVYVANANVGSVSVISASTFQPVRRIQVPGSPKRFAAPAFGPMIYVAVGAARDSVQCIHTQTDTLAEPLEYPQNDAVSFQYADFIAVTPDNRALFLSSSSWTSPLLYELSHASLGAKRQLAEKHHPSFVADHAADRVYAGSFVYSADLTKRLATISNCDLLAPHPSKRLLFGRQRPPDDPNLRQINLGTTVVVYDEETLAPLKTIEIGDRVLAFVPTEESLYVVSRTKVYPVALKTQLEAEALSRAKPVRNNADLAKIGAESAATRRRTTYTLPPVGGWALLEDQKTLALAITEKAEIIFIDTMDGTELRKATLDFQPASLCVQGGTLFAVRANSSLLHALDAATGREKKEFKIPGDPLVRVACAPKGRIYASNARGHVLSIDPSSGSATNTGARGLFLAVDPKGQYVYTGRTSPKDWDVEVEENKDGTTTWYYDNWGYRSMIRKYAVSGATLKHVAENDNTAVNGRTMVLSPDGSKIAMVGGGGWRPKREGAGGGYTIAIYDTKDLKTMLGQVNLGAYPHNVAFHPVLDIGVSLRSGAGLSIFNTKSMTSVKNWQVNGAPQDSVGPGRLMIAGRGETLVYWQISDGEARTGKLYLIPLELTAEEKAALQKAYGKGAAPAAVDPAKLFGQAEEAARKGDMAAALRLYRRVVEEDPASDLGKRAVRKMHDLEDADEAAAPGSSEALLKIAETLFKNGDKDNALRYYKRLVHQFGGTPEAAEARKKIQEIENK